ncbi:hypothetical protein AB9M62_31550 [Bacillales bacterium AN1005]
MSKISDQLEYAIKKATNKGKLPSQLQQWLLDLGVTPGVNIISSERIGGDRNNKTDIIIYLENSTPIKISAKLSNADYFGNWYGHTRFIDEFGEEAFRKLSRDSTDWANWWLQQATAPFVGVSICFGRRSGNTAKEFLDIFDFNDIVKVVAGYGLGNHVANCLYISSNHPNNIEDVINNLRPINPSTLESISKNFKIAYRPINPMTEYSNRGKNIYTMFQPYKKLSQLETVTSPRRLAQLGCFVEVDPNRMNHNHVLDRLNYDYNIYIPRKPK